MNKQYEPLFTPWNIGKLTIKNRIAMAPMEATSIVDGLLHCQYKSAVHDFYIERAKDGVGLMIPGMIPVRTALANDSLINHPEAFEPVKGLMDEIHQYGAKVFFQLGTFSGRNFVLSSQMLPLIHHPEQAPAPMQKLVENMVSADEGAPNVWLPDEKCRALSVNEVEELVQSYAQLALLCKNANVDGVEIHAVHEGYLMDQFTTKYTNHRTDKYGGSLENRYRFAVEVVRAIKELCGEDYPVSMRYSVTSKTIGFNIGAVPGETFTEAGRDMAESEIAIKLLEDAGVDMFNCDNGTYDAWFWAHPPVYMPLNCNLPEVRHIKKFTTKPVFCAGRMQLDAAAKEIAEGGLDGVSIGRQFLCDEQFLTKIREGQDEEVRPCISCHSGCFPLYHFKGVGAENAEAVSGSEHETRTCALNSHTFAEKKYPAPPAAHAKHIAVIGGGIGGMEFAIEAQKRGHAVTLYEKSDRLGGAFISAAALSFKEKDRELLAWFRRELQKSGATVHLNTEVTDPNGLNADEVVIATGATARKLGVPGAERAVTAIDFLLNKVPVGEKVAVIGGGLTGCEIAYELALQGKKPFLVEMLDDVIKVPGVSAANSGMLRELIRYHKIPLYLESSVTEIWPNSVVLQTREGEKIVEADSVITSIGYIPAPLTLSSAHIHVIGDAAKVGNLKTVIWAADELAATL